MNEKRRYPAYSNSDFSLTGTDMMIKLEIPEINTVVTYKGSCLRIQLPYDLFSGNTEGQCGEFLRMFGNTGCKKQFNGYNSNSVVCLIMCCFRHNTSLLTGTCDNSRPNDCRAPNGQLEACKDSAHQWAVPGIPCGTLETPTTTKAPLTTSRFYPTCDPVVCEILASR